MKKKAFYFILILAGTSATFGCTPDHETPAERETSSLSAGDEQAGSQNAADWAATYHGTLPCADCDGIDTKMTLLEDGTYELTTRYLGKSDEYHRESGTFSWSEEGDRIQLEIEDGSRSPYYLLEENKFIHLDLDANRLTSALAHHYILINRIKPISDHLRNHTKLYIR